MFLDLILILIIVAFVLKGLRKGLISSLGSFLGFVFTLFIMSRLYPWLMIYFNGTFWTKILVFIFALIVISIIIRIAIWIVERVFKVFSFIPGTKSINRLLGAGLGLISGLLLASFLVWMILKLPLENSWLQIQVENSYLVKPMLLIAYVWIPVVPRVYQGIRNY